MARRKYVVSSRDRGHRLVRWLLLIVAGLGGGLLLGEMAAENLHSVAARVGAPYSGLSANPEASRPAALSQDACLNCPDSYGAAARMRADRDARMDDAFRELGAVDAGASPFHESADEYRYGGRYPDPAPSASEAAMLADTPADDTSDLPFSGDTPP